MAAGRSAADVKPRRIGAECHEMLLQPMQRSARLANNAVHRSLRGQGVARDRDIEATGERSFGDKAEALFGIPLPIAAMKEQQRRCAGAVRGEEIEAGAWR